MEKETIKYFEIIINKNRGWRGLAEVVVRDESHSEQIKAIFSFSQAVWDDLMAGRIIIQDDKHYYLFEIDNTDKLPIGHQRSVLIKNFKAKIIDTHIYEKASWTSATGKDWATITHFIKNKNNHTTSDWNCIGVRVVPVI